MAVIFVCKFIYKAYYVCGKQPAYNSAQNSNNKFNNNWCHVQFTSFRSEVSMQTEYYYSDVTQTANHPI